MTGKPAGKRVLIASVSLLLLAASVVLFVLEFYVIAVSLLGVVAVAALLLTWRTSVAMEANTVQHLAFAERFTAVTDVEAEVRDAQETFAEEKKEQAKSLKAAHDKQAASLKASHKRFAQEKAAHAAALDKSEARNSELAAQYRTANNTYKELKLNVAMLEDNLEDISFGLYTPHFQFDTPEEYKDALKKSRDIQRNHIRAGTAVNVANEWTVAGSRAEGKKMERQYTKVMLRAFNGDSDAAVARVSWNNASKMEQRVEKSFADINKLGATMMMSISPAYRDEKLKEVRLTRDHQEKKHQEREEQRELRQEMREQEKAEREFEKAKEKAEQEEQRHREALEKARAEANAATGKQLEKLTEQIASLEGKVIEAQGRKEKAVARAQLTKSGFVYVISNVGSLGEGVVKIGMTRRMEPMDRVRELSDASVPFQFDTHVMMFSDNAPDLEHALHTHFKDRQVNLVNSRKEFYRDVELDEVETFIRTRGVTAQFLKNVEAREYRETQAILLERENVPHVDDRFPDDPFGDDRP